jgi:hypothetical protein
LRNSISVAGRDAGNRPAVARAFGCSLSADRRLLSVFLCPAHAVRLLACLRETGAIAVAISRPSTHVTLQLKGNVIDIRPLSTADRAVMDAYRASFVDEIVALGYRPEFARGMVPGGEACLAVRFTPSAVFDQTPGPRAGARLAPVVGS